MMAEWIVRTPGNPATKVRFVSSRSRMLFQLEYSYCIPAIGSERA